MKTTRVPRKHRAFTLIELLAVISIIVILAALVVVGVGSVLDRQAREKTRVQLALISEALERYREDTGHYPLTANATDPGSTNVNLLYQALFYEGYSYQNQAVPPVGWTKATKIYLPDFDPVTSKHGWMDRPANGEVPSSISHLRDPYGNDYRYRSSGNLADSGTNSNTVNSDFDLWSVGRDSRTNGSPAQPAHPDNRDDMRNFIQNLGIAFARGED